MNVSYWKTSAARSHANIREDETVRVKILFVYTSQLRIILKITDSVRQEGFLASIVAHMSQSIF